MSVYTATCYELKSLFSKITWVCSFMLNVYSKAKNVFVSHQLYYTGVRSYRDDPWIDRHCPKPRTLSGFETLLLKMWLYVVIYKLYDFILTDMIPREQVSQYE